MIEPIDIFNPHFTEVELTIDRYKIRPTSPEEQVSYHRIFHQLPIGIYQATITGQYLTINQKLAEIFGYSSTQEMLITVNNLRDVYLDSHRHQELINLLKTGKKNLQLESQVYKQDGSTLWILENISPVISDQVIGYIATVEDITSTKQKSLLFNDGQDQFSQPEQNKYKFLSMISHEMKSALTIIMIASDFLRLHGNKLSFSHSIKYLQKITNTVQNLTNMIDSFMILAKAEQRKLKLETIYLQEFLQEVWEDVQAIYHSKHKLVLSSDYPTLQLCGDKVLFRQILINLLGNAVKYSPTGDQVRVELYRQDQKIRINIIDQGLGISIEDQGELFSVFHRGDNVTSIPGTGLGLVIVKQAVELHSGTISVYSKINQGTTFTLTFPLQPTQ